MKTSGRKHEISGVVEGSIACELGLADGDFLISINGEKIRDELHYRFLTEAEFLTLEIEQHGASITIIELEKDPEEELGLLLVFPVRSCHNKCVFCFVDQQPDGLRESLYVKDDDHWLSYLMGNYITLTNLNAADIKRILYFHLSPLRISVHAADMDLRKKMMGSNKAGGLFKSLETFSHVGIKMHFQAVLCKGLNDGHYLSETIKKLSALDGAESLAIVPAGLTRHREGLYPLEQFLPEEAAVVIEVVEGFQKNFRDTHGRGFVFPSDEWYIMADKSLPDFKAYEDFPQLDNGVGMLRLFEKSFRKADASRAKKPLSKSSTLPVGSIGIITGHAAGAFIKELAAGFEKRHPGVKVNVHVITNYFFGEMITVSGLLTGQDIITHLRGCVTEDVLYLPENAFRAGETVMLDGVTQKELSAALGVTVKVGSTDGGKFYRQLAKEANTCCNFAHPNK